MYQLPSRLSPLLLPTGIDASCQLRRILGYDLPTLVLENKRIYKFLAIGGVFSGNTHEECTQVHNGIPMIHFGNYMYQQYVYGVVICMVYRLLSFDLT